MNKLDQAVTATPSELRDYSSRVPLRR